MTSKLPASAKTPVAGKATPAPAKPSNKMPVAAKSQAKPVAKPAPKVAKAKVKDPKAVITPYGTAAHAK